MAIAQVWLYAQSCNKGNDGTLILDSSFAHLLGLGRDNLCIYWLVTCHNNRFRTRQVLKHTLNIGNALLQNLLQDLGVLQLLLDLGNDGSGELLLLALLNLALVADPGLENRLGLGGQGSLLLELVGLSLELGGFLRSPMSAT